MKSSWWTSHLSLKKIGLLQNLPPPPQSMLIILPALWSFRVWSTLCRGDVLLKVGIFTNSQKMTLRVVQLIVVFTLVKWQGSLASQSGTVGQTDSQVSQKDSHWVSQWISQSFHSVSQSSSQSISLLVNWPVRLHGCWQQDSHVSWPFRQSISQAVSNWVIKSISKWNPQMAMLHSHKCNNNNKIVRSTPESDYCTLLFCSKALRRWMASWRM